MNISIREIKYILTVAEEKNISRAALKLNISQPALSQAILKIEATIGVPLFARNKNGFSLTNIGHIFVEYGTKILESMDAIENYLHPSDTHTQESLSVGIPYYLSSIIMPPVLHEFDKAHPNINIMLTELPSHNLETELIQRRISMAIIPLPIQSTGIDYTELIHSRMSIFLSEDDPLTKKLYTKEGCDGNYIDLHELRDAPFIMLKKNQRTTTVAETLMHNANIDHKISYVTQNFDTLKQLVSNGMGIALVPDIYITETEEKSLKLTRAYLEESQDFPWIIVAAYEAGSRLSRGSYDFIRFIKKTWIQYNSDQ